VARFLSTAHGRGVRRILHAADAHQPDAPEFEAFPPHCLRGSEEAAVVPELRGLSFAESIRLVSKGSINVGQEAELESLLAAHAAARCWVIVGDCTDLCVYQAAMHLKLRANARGERLEVCVPADLVQTYDLPIAAAEGIGALPHPGDLMHRLFLYHLALNGVRVVRALSA
jgi:nicotinamidase-related amidase